MKIPLLSPMSDAVLLRRLRANDRTAFETVVSANYEAVYRQTWYLCGDPDAASDLTQETFVEAWRSISSFQGRSSLQTWLYTLAVRVWYRSRRMAAARPAESLLSEALAAALADNASPAPGGIAEDSVRRALLNSAIAELPAAYRKAVRLFYTEELKYREIAVSENIPIGTVKSRLNSALRHLHRRLSAHEEELL